MVGRFANIFADILVDSVATLGVYRAALLLVNRIALLQLDGGALDIVEGDALLGLGRLDHRGADLLGHVRAVEVLYGDALWGGDFLAGDVIDGGADFFLPWGTGGLLDRGRGLGTSLDLEAGTYLGSNLSEKNIIIIHSDYYLFFFCVTIHIMCQKPFISDSPDLHTLMSYK